MKRILQGLMVILAVGILCGVLGYFLKGDDKVEYAASFEELTVFIETAQGTDYIKIWQADDGKYYFFLPSYVGEGTKIRIGNLQNTDVVSLNGKDFGAKTNISDEIEWGKEYEAVLQINDTKGKEETIVFLKSERVATVYVETESGGVEAIHANKEEKEKARLTIKDAQGQVSYDNQIEYIKTRGNSSFIAYDKKAYQVKLYNKAGILGMNKAKKWLLLANYVDNTLLRNQLVYGFVENYADTLQSITGVYTDLYINGEYVGNYYLCEKVEVEENRLDITDLEELNEALNTEDALKTGEQYVSEDGNIRAVKGLKSPDNITGGYLVEIIPVTKYEVARSAFRTNGGKYFEIVSPENATVEEAEYICNLFNEIEGAICQEDGINPNTNKHFTEYIDLETWGNKYLIEEFFHNPDAPGASYFFYKEANDPLVYAGPMWDYDRAMGSWAVGGYSYYVDLPQGIGYYGVYAPELMQHEIFSDYVKGQFKEIICPYIENQLKTDVARWQKEIEGSAQLNKIRWPETRGYYASPEADRDYMVYFLEERLDYFKEVWLQDELYHTVSFIDYEGRIANQYVVKHGECLEQVPEVKNYISLFNGWKSVETGKAFDIRLPVMEDAVYQSQWIDASLLLANGLSMADMDIQQVDIEAIEALLNCIKEQRGIVDHE